MKDLQRMLKDIEMEVTLTRHLTGKDALDSRVMAAMRKVPRHAFLPVDLRHYAYENGPASIGSGQTISQPFIVALMSDLLNTKPTDTILEIGTGSGYQSAILSTLVKQVYSVEIIENLANSARDRLEKLGYHNVEFRLGDIENLPVETKTADVIISNCVLNLVPDKVKAFHEIYRVLRTGGHFSVSDVVLKGELPVPLKEAAEMYAGCVSGAVQKDEYLKIIDDCRFVNIKVQKEKPIIIPNEILLKYMTREEMERWTSPFRNKFKRISTAESTCSWE